MLFEIADKTATPAKRARSLKDDEEDNENVDADENQKEEKANESIEENADVMMKNESKENCIVDSVGEVDDDQDHIQLTMAESENLETSNVDNEDSLNLTIGEDEAKIFIDQEVRTSENIFVFTELIRHLFDFRKSMRKSKRPTVSIVI